MKDKCAIVDICGTLYASNTTFDFLDFYFSNNDRYRRFSRIRRSDLWRVFNKLIWIFFGMDLTRKIAIQFLKGEPMDRIQGAVKCFVTNILEKKKHGAVFELINTLRKDGFRIVVTSATLDVIAREVSSRLNVDECYATELCFDSKGTCLGKIAHDLLGCKKEYLEANGIMPPFNAVITDDFSDIELIKNSDRSYVVCNDRSIQKWESRKNRLGILNIKWICI